MGTFLRGVVLGALGVVLLLGIATDAVGMAGTLALMRQCWMPLWSWTSIISYAICLGAIGFVLGREVRARKLQDE